MAWEPRRRQPHRPERDLVREAREAQLRAELDHRFEVGGLEEAVLRALVYIRLPEGSIDERGFADAEADPRSPVRPPSG